MGVVGPNDVRALQTKVQHYHELLLVALDTFKRGGAALPTSGPFTQDAWDALTAREEQFLAESVSELNPMAYIFAGGAYDRGRELIASLDTWRDWLANQKAPGVTVPDAIPVPGSDLSIASALGLAGAALLAFLIFRELHR